MKIKKMIEEMQFFLRKLETRFWKDRRSSVHPSLFQFDYLQNLSLYQVIKSGFIEIRKQSKKNKFNTLDIGCGHKPYYDLFKPHASKYIGVDVDKKLADVVASADKLPFRNSSFDLVLCFQTLEHCKFPGKVIAEIVRVLKPNGFVILTTHGSWMHHPSPHDYYRWTEEGLETLFKDFSQIQVSAQLKAWSSLIQLVNVELYRIATNNIFWKLPVNLAIFFINILGKILINQGQNYFTINYIVTARK